MGEFGKAVGTGVAIILVGIVTVCLVVARSLLPQMGVTFVSGLTTWMQVTFFVLTVLSIVALPTLLAIGLYFLLRPRYTESGQFGGYVHSALGKWRALPPLNPVAGKIAGASVTEVTPTIPKLGELIRQGLLTEQSTDGVKMLMGFSGDETPRYEPMPGVTAVLGMQNVGKSVTMLMLIIIALFQGAKVVICDTHYAKARSLYKKVQGLQGFVTFATTEEAVLQETVNFSQELAGRKQGGNPYPYIIFYDEMNSLVRSEKLKEQLVTTMGEAAQEGLGFHMHMVAAIHDVSNQGIGDARLRDFFNWIFCHRMLSGQSKFIEAFNVRKIREQIAKLPQGHAMVKDEVNDVEYLMIPYGDSRDVLEATRALQQQGSVRIGEYSPTHKTDDLRLLGEYSPMVNEPVKRGEQDEPFTDTQGLENIHREYSPVTEQDRTVLMDTYIEMNATGMKFTRTDLCIKAFGNKKRYSIVKEWCNERHVLMEGAHV